MLPNDTTEDLLLRGGRLDHQRHQRFLHGLAATGAEEQGPHRDTRTVLDTVPKDVGILGVRRRLMIWLVVTGTMELNVHSVGNFIIPTDELIFFRGVETTNQYI